MNRRAQRKLAVVLTLGVIGVAAPVTGSITSASAENCVTNVWVEHVGTCVLYPDQERTFLTAACNVDYADTCGSYAYWEWWDFWHPAGYEEYYCVSTPGQVTHNVCLVWNWGTAPPFCNQQYVPNQQSVVNYYCIKDPLGP